MSDGKENLNTFMFWYIVVTINIIFLYEGMQDSIIAPIFPIQSKLYHNSSETFIGLTMAANDIGDLISSTILINFFTDFIPNKYHFVLLCATSGSSLVVFGISDKIQDQYLYQFLQFILRIFSGLVVGFNYCFAVSYLSYITDSLRLRAVLITTIVTAFYAGVSIAPFFSTLLYNSLGYTNIMILIGGVSFISAIFLLPTKTVRKRNISTENSQAYNTVSPFILFKRKKILVQIYCQIVANNVWGFFDATLAMILFTDFGLNQIDIGYAFSLGTLLTLISSTSSIYINSKGLHKCIFIVSILIHALAVAVLSLSVYINNLFGVVFAYALHSCAKSMTLGASTLYMKDLIENEFEDALVINSIAYAAPASNILSLTGRSLGLFCFGGLLFDHMGYLVSVNVVLILITIGALAEFYMVFRANKIGSSALPD